MRSTTIAWALMASCAIAQPHGHHIHHRHDKREVVTEWVTQYETATVLIGDYTTETILPTKSAKSSTVTTSSNGGEFFQSPTPTSSTVVAVPTPTVETVEAAPTTSTPQVEPVASTTAEAAPAATTSSTSSGSSSSSSGAKSKSGQMTYYTPGLGSCGYEDSGSATAVAVDITFFQAVSPLTNYGVDQPANPLCNQEITISVNGATTTGVIRDSCPGCGTDGIDVTEAIFTTLMGGTTDGHVEVTWWLNTGLY